METKDAYCLDGTAPMYYHRPGTGSGANKWFVFHQGGGWCVPGTDCYNRAQGNLGSSKAYPTTMNLNSGYYSTDASVNP